MGKSRSPSRLAEAAGPRRGPEAEAGVAGEAKRLPLWARW